jgi:glycosyltransferase involved in cell wall biosynthesis
MNIPGTVAVGENSASCVLMQPFVSIIVPCYNEEKTIHHLLEAVFAQTYPRASMELIISDGNSTDRTREVIKGFQGTHSDLHIRVVDNDIQAIPAGLNRAIRESRGEFIIRLDAHSVPIHEYVERCVMAHQAGKGDNIGGVWEIHPGEDTWVAHSISFAAAHPLGVGDAMYRLKAKEGPVDTVPFGSFSRALIDRIGLFDETLLANEDYEFNTRVRENGGIVWLDPAIRSVYFSRSTLAKLGRQYWRYGYWKWRMLQRYPHTLRWRQALPPLFVASLVMLSVLSLWVVPFRLLLAVEITLYFMTLTLAGIKLALDGRKIYLIFGLPLAIATMHLAWGAGFLWSMLVSPFIKHG